MKKTLWLRKLSCGHERPANIAFVFGLYDKPKIGDKCFFRRCCEPKVIVKVVETVEDINFLNNMAKEVKR